MKIIKTIKKEKKKKVFSQKNQRNKLYLFWLGIFLFFLISFQMNITFADGAGFDIDNYEVTIDLQENGIVKVEEDIQVNFNEERHGIYRKIPFRYWSSDTENGKKNKHTKIQLYDIQVPWYNFSTYTDWDYKNIKIWSADFTLTWLQDYTIKYNAYKVIRAYSGYQEFYRNIIWTERDFEVKKIDFKITLPKAYIFKEGEYFLYYGKLGEKKEAKLEIKDNTVFLDQDLSLDSNEWLTIGLKFPEEYFVLSLKDDVFFLLSRTPWYFSIFLLPVLLSFVLSFLFKKKFGEKTKIRDIIYYTPPKWYSPWKVAAIYQKEATNKIVFSMIYEWAVKWYVKIINNKGENIVLEKTKELASPFEAEQKFWKILWKKWTKKTLSKSLYSTTRMVNDETFESVSSLFAPNGLKFGKELDTIWANIGVWVFLVFFLCIFDMYYNWLFWVLLVNFLIIAIIFSYYGVISKNTFTDEWRVIYEQIVWFRKYIKAVEEKKLKYLLKEDPQYFEKILPFAVAFGLESMWIKKADKILRERNYQANWVEWTAINKDNSALELLNLGSAFSSSAWFSGSIRTSSSGWSFSSGWGFSSSGGSSGWGAGGWWWWSW